MIVALPRCFSFLFSDIKNRIRSFTICIFLALVDAVKSLNSESGCGYVIWSEIPV